MDADLDHERCYRAVASRDARFDGTFCTAVRTTGVYCRPSCPAMTPRRANVTFFRTPAAAQRAGFRACRRCRPDAVPGSPEWNVRTDVVGRAMRLVVDGTVERSGVAGVAAALGYSERHLNRLVTAELGAGLLAIARAQRAHTARILLETTDLPAADVAWAAGFGSVRAFNEAIRTTYGEAPTALRARRRRSERVSPAQGRGDRRSPADDGGGLLDADDGARTMQGDPHAPVTVRLATRAPFDPEALLTFLGDRAIAGMEAWDGTTYRRSLALPHGHGVVDCRATAGGISAAFRLADLRDLAPAVARVRRLLDLDADPAAVVDLLGADPMLAPWVAARPGLRIPGCVDAHEVLVRGVAGQQVSVAGARTVVGRLVAGHGQPLALADPVLTHVFPTPDALAAADPAALSMPRARGATIVRASAALAEGSLTLDPGADRDAARAALLALPGIGPWTVGYVAMRGLGDPDVMLEADLGVRHAVAALGGDDLPRAITDRAHAWRPWRSYAVAHLWAGLRASSSAGAPGAAGADPGRTPAGRGAGAAAADSVPTPAGRRAGSPATSRPLRRDRRSPT
jgi:AraC family transcriptional regulator of adaptative response / DNA-3-methyladenine glycosylase II